MNYPIAMIPYANMSPYAALGPPDGCYFVRCTPRNSIEALRSGAVWAAAVPVGGLDQLKDEVTPVGMFGIAALQKVMSVLFFSDKPLEEFGPRTCVRLTEESASSVRLLYLLMRQRLGPEKMPKPAVQGTAAQGELVIGDTALKWLHAWENQGKVKTYTHVADLAGLWHQQHQLPFVFARWVVRLDAPDRLQNDLHQWLERFSGQEPALIDQAVPKVASQLNLPNSYVRRYLKVIRRCLTSSDAAGQALFQKQWRESAAEGEKSWFAPAPAPAGGRRRRHG